MDENQKRIDEGLDLLQSHAKEHELEGVEFTEEDACRVMAMVDAGCEPEEAAHILLISIRNCLDEGLYDED